ncbi:MAG: YdeI/OmpD-associated family protein [Planctomycetes bacterium]|nr:YdeI/OmpD-associated family protein [Planctomycetota bacterium]
MPGVSKPRFFKNAAAFREWLEKNHATASELFIGYYKKHTDRFNYSWAETVDEALCFGWIDGIRRRIDDDRYMIRFTPRKQRSIWSDVNFRRVSELKKLGRMHAAGIAAFNARDAAKSKQQETTRRDPKLDADYEKTFRKNKKAWEFFQSQPPGYRRTAIFWIMSAKKPKTREKRLNTLIEDSKNGRRLPATM